MSSSNLPTKQTTSPLTEQLQGVVERVTYHSTESGYTVIRLKAPQTKELITVVGSFASIQPGQTLQLTGIWRDHPRYGIQFQVNQYREMKPATLTGIEKYLGSGLIKGVGPVTAKRIVAHFGLTTLDIIENHIERLGEVPGIAKKRISWIQAAWEAQKAIKEVMVFLQGHGVSTTYAVKIYKQYGDASIETVTRNPYQLATDVYGIGFVTADTIARHLGIAPNSEFRYRSGLLHVLNKAAEDGHCFLPEAELVEKARERLALPDHQPDPTKLLAITGQMGTEKELIVVRGSGRQQGELVCYAPAFFTAERSLAQRLSQLLEQPVSADLSRIQSWIDRFTEKTGIQLNGQQRRGVEMAASSRVLILTGGPGCGKTFTTRIITALWKAMGKSLTLASPTGRAAQRLSEMTGLKATTLHRLLEFDPKTYSFKRHSDNPLPAAAIVVDEASMLDLFLANSLIKAVPKNAQLLLVGDIDQLPSVGPGSVLRDLIRSERVPLVRLTEVFRQAQTSQIVVNAHRINQGKYPVLERISNQPQSDCIWFEVKEPTHGVQAIRDLLGEEDLVPALGFDRVRDVQVLCPMTRGEVGTRHLNTVLQEVLNPPNSAKTEMVRGGMTLRVGDRVIQKVNDYHREVFNGDMGVINQIDLEQRQVTVRYEDREVNYDYADLDEISLAWSISIHKSQGSEYPVVILPLFMQSYTMLSRNLLYTGLTRAKQLAILVGQQKAISIALRQVKDQQRYTLLARRLRYTASDIDT